MKTQLIPLSKVESVPGWPYSTWATRKLIREGKLGCVRPGDGDKKSKCFVTVELLEAFVAKHTVTP